MKRTLSVKHLGLAVLLAISFTACGGGGGGSDGEGTPPTISYTGLTTQAAIDENNAEDLSAGAYQGGQIGDVFSSVGAIQALEPGPVSQPRMLKVAQVLEDSLHKVDLTSSFGATMVGAITTDSGIIDGNCGGNASFTIRVDDQSGNFSGSLTFNKYCQDGATISGAVSYAGTINVNTDELSEFSFSFDNLAADSGSDAYTLNGDISFVTTFSDATMTMAMLLKDHNTGKVFKFEDYIISIAGSSSHEAFEVYGKYFDPDYGVVSITTNKPFRIESGSEWPSEGILVVTGKSGIAGGSSMARLTALSSANYQVEADTTGDGTYDWNSGTLNWSDL